jgi:RAD51-like protein 3
MKLKNLNCTFLSDNDILKLNLINIHTSEQLVTFSDLSTLSRQTSIQLKNLKLIKKFIIGQYSPFPQFGNALFDKYIKKNFITKTGCSQMDLLISSGIYSSEITEITGATSTGKTQLCFNLIANSNTKVKCLYVDSSRNFCVKRLVRLLKAKHKNNPVVVEDIAKQIKVVECVDIFHLMDILFSIKKVDINLISNNEKNSETIEFSPNLLIIDNLTSLFCQFKISNSINFYLNSVSNCLKYLATQMNMAIVVVTNSNDANASFTYSSNSYLTSSINFNCLYNSTWKSVPNLVVGLKSVPNENERNYVKQFEVVKINRPSISEAPAYSVNTRVCQFKIEENGLSGIV